MLLLLTALLLSSSACVDGDSGMPVLFAVPDLPYKEAYFEAKQFTKLASCLRRIHDKMTRFEYDANGFAKVNE